MKSFKFVDGKVKVVHLTKIADGGLARNRKHDFEEEMEPHPDLLNELAKMKRMLAYQIGLTRLQAVVEAKEFEATKAQIKYTEKAVEEILEDVKVTGFSLSGDSLDKVKITGSYAGIGLAGKLFSLTGDSQGFEDQARQVIDVVKDEVYEYIFNLKRAQLEMFEEEPAE